MPRSGRQPTAGTLGVSMPRPAPGAMEVVQAFVNTASTDRQADALASPAALSLWLSSRGMVLTESEISEQDLQQALDVREALAALLAAKTGEPDVLAAVRLARIAGTAQCRLRYDEEGPSGFEPAESSLKAAIGAILAAYVVARAMSDWPHFKLCARKGCGRAFYDASRSRTGKWCTQRCGNRARGATYRRSRKYH